MARFPNLILEDVVQVNDKTRLNATKSFISKTEGAITLVEIEAESGSGYVTVGAPGTSKDWYLDWQYSTAGTKTVSCRVTNAGGNTISTATLVVKSVADDALFSSDSDLVALEHDVMKWVPEGRSSFLNYHRKAQKLILAWLDENGHWDTNGARLTADAMVDLEEVKYWSAALTLQLIFSSISNDPNDIFQQKAKQYESMAIGHRNRSVLRLDVDGDGTVSNAEGTPMKSLGLVRS